MADTRDNVLAKLETASGLGCESIRLDVQIQNIIVGPPIALLIDDVNAVSDAMLEQFSDRLLTPLSRENNALIVLAERGRPYYWTDPMFRLRSEVVELTPFARAEKRKVKEKTRDDCHEQA